jgi:hypothetical protein
MKESVLLVKPAYYSRYPPVALMKLSTLLKQGRRKVTYVEGCNPNVGFYPSEVYITSLYTYEWRAVHESVSFYKQRFPRSGITVGGTYATLMPERLKPLGVRVHTGQYLPADKIKLDYSLFPQWGKSIVTSSRGCIRRCSFCAVKYLEPRFECLPTVKDQIQRNHTGTVVWDNNLLASPHRNRILTELADSGRDVDFCQGLDIRLVDEGFLSRIGRLRFSMLRFAYDVGGLRVTVAKQVARLVQAGIRPRDIFFYILYNYRDSPDLLLSKVQDVLDMGCVAYPMRYEPLDSLERGSHIGENWNARLLDMVSRFRRVLGCNGALPPYDGLRMKICTTSSFEKAFSLRPPR